MKKTGLFLLLFGVSVLHALAATACRPGWGWLSNSKDQNPCKVVSVLNAGCLGPNWSEVDPLKEGAQYPIPQTDASSQKCLCNTVVYSLYMACTTCQNAPIKSWSSWQQHCEAPEISWYPGDIPLDTAVPDWAYLPYGAGDAFNDFVAKAAGDVPERSTPFSITALLPGSSTNSDSNSAPGTLSETCGPTPNQPNTVVPPTSSIASVVPTGPVPTGPPFSGNFTGPIPAIPTGPPTGQAPQNNQTGKPSKVVSIVGGVIGGLAFLTILGLGAWVYFRIRKRFSRNISEDHPDYYRYLGGLATPENVLRTPMT